MNFPPFDSIIDLRSSEALDQLPIHLSLLERRNFLPYDPLDQSPEGKAFFVIPFGGDGNTEICEERFFCPSVFPLIVSMNSSRLLGEDP